MDAVIDAVVVNKILGVVDAGLVKGVGKPIPGQMCVEAAVCFAFGLPHGDDPPCVGRAVRSAKIRLNDSAWSSDMARAKGMRRVAIAQLGSNKFDQVDFSKRLVTEVIRTIVPIALRAAATLQKAERHKTALEAAAKQCEADPTKASALVGKKAAAAAAADAAYAYAAAYAAYAATYAAYAAAYAAYAATYAAYAAAYAAADAAAAYAADAAAATYAAYAAAYARASARDEVLSSMAEIIVKVLTDMDCEGCKWLYLAEAA